MEVILPMTNFQILGWCAAAAMYVIINIVIVFRMISVLNKYEKAVNYLLTELSKRERME